MIDIDSLDVVLGGTTILDAVSLTVGDGQFLALVGPNGAGKTTLLRTCNGLLSPTRGTVTVDGRTVSSLSPREVGRLVATVPQETTLAFDFEVSEVVAMGRTPHRSRFSMANDADRAAVESALSRTDTEQFAERSVGELSGGERQRVVFARALAQETPVLLLDEPTASLDINHQVRTLSLARELANDGKTVVAAIHDLDLAARFCDAVALLSGGEILATGTPETVLDAERLETAFGVRTAVATNPVTGTPSVTPLSDAPPGERRVHVFGGGPRAARTIGRLVDAGIEVTAGVLPNGDAATATARSVAREVVTAAPFEDVATDRLRAAASLAEDADVSVIAGPLDESNARVAADSEHLVALEGIDEETARAEVITEAELLAAVRSPPSHSPKKRS
jgi:iron complex transport system ATP-binding protein